MKDMNSDPNSNIMFTFYQNETKRMKNKKNYKGTTFYKQISKVLLQVLGLIFNVVMELNVFSCHVQMELKRSQNKLYL